MYHVYRARFASALTAAAVLALGACSDSTDSSPTSPLVAKSTTAALTACNARAFRDARGFARSYFAQPTQGAAVGLIDAMENEADPVRTEKGLDLFHLVALGADVTGTAADGSNLLNTIAACSNLGLTDEVDWTGALGPQGALAVVGDGSANVSSPVYAKDLFSAVAPPAGKGWSAWLRLPDDDFDDARAVIYGAPFEVDENLSPEPVIGERGFDWNTLPARPFPFGLDPNDDGFFGICVESPSTARVQNNHPTDGGSIDGLLGTYDPGLPPLGLDCEGFTVGGLPLPQTSSLLRRAIDLLSPQPAHAAALSRKTGGTPGGFSDHFVVGPSALRVIVTDVRNGNVGQNLDSEGAGAGVTVLVETVLPNGDPGVALQLVEVTLEIVGNQGEPADIDGDLDVLTDEFGVATFDDVKLFSAGGYTLRAFTTDGLSGLPAAEDLSNLFHIKNKGR